MLSRVPARVWLAIIWAVLFFLGVTGYPNLLDNERRIAAYVLDILQNGHWIAQHDALGDFMSKPPAFTWLVVLISWCTGGLSLFSLYLPSALATLGVAFVLLRAGKQYFGYRAGLLAALMYLLSYVTDEQLTTARYDGLFALPVTIGALAAYQGWREGRGWFVFWMAMTAGAMVKGPLVFVLSGVGLLACLWERDAGYLFRWRWQHSVGIAVFALVCGGWLGLVLAGHRDEFVQKMLHRELIAHVVNDGGKYLPGQRFWEAPGSAFLFFLPWTPLGIYALIRTWRDRAKTAGHSFERFLACWFLVGLFLFSVAAHQSGRLIWPLIPALALLSGHQLDIWLKNLPERVLYRWATIAAILVITVSGLYHQVLLRSSTRCRETLAMRDLAAVLRQEFGNQPQIVYVDAPFAVQFYLGYLRFNTGAKDAAHLLNGNTSAYVLASDRGAQRVLSGVTNQIFTLYAWPSKQKPSVALLSNRPKMAMQ